MSKSTLSHLKSEIRMETGKAHSAGSSLTGLEKSISGAMDDRVGNSARESIKCIYNAFSYGADGFFKSANSAASALDRGYSKIEVLLSQGEKHLAQARAIVEAIGDYE